MKSANPKLLKGRHALMIAVTISTFAALDRAEAACDPVTSSVSPLIGTTVTCTGTTGYGVEEDQRNTINANAGTITGGMAAVLRTAF
jgi:hypothetical protein